MIDHRSELAFLRERLADWDGISADLEREFLRLEQLRDRASRECAKIRTRIDQLEEGS